jgi:hypothetical protein
MLDVLVDTGKIDLEGEVLIVTDGGYRYKIQEAVRVLREVTTGDDPPRLCGKVRIREELSAELGAELLGSSMLVEDAAYDVVPGFLGEPLGDAENAPKPELGVLMELGELDA